MLRKGRKQTAALALAAILLGTAPAASAAGFGWRKPVLGAAHEESFWALAWRWAQGLRAKKGACIDPDSSSVPCAGSASGESDPASEPSAESDQSAHIDPNG